MSGHAGKDGGAMQEMTAAQQEATNRLIVAFVERQRVMQEFLKRGSALMAEAETDVPDWLLLWGIEVGNWLLRDQAMGAEMRSLMREHFSDEDLAAAEQRFEGARRDLG